MSDFRTATGIDWNAGGLSGVVKYGDDSNLLVMFYNRSVQVASDQGRPIHRDEIYIKIQQPGEMLNIIDRPANDGDKQRFRQQWSNFVHDRTQVPEGTPIDLLFPNHPSVAANLRAYGVFTIEQCAALSANAIDTVGRGGQEYVNRAKKYIDSATKGTAFHKLQRENEELTQKTRILEHQVQQMRDQLDRMTLKVNDPIRSSLNPPQIQGYDVQSERINANAPTKIVRQRAPKVEEAITDPLGGGGGQTMEEMMRD